MNPDGDVPEWQAKLKSDIGENPARFLDQKIPSIPESPTSMFRARVEGIDQIAVIGAWMAAERRLANEQDREPRQHVLDLLDRRRQHLQEHGERPEDLRAHYPHELPDRYQPADRSTPEKDVTWVDEDEGDRRPWSRRPTGVSVGRAFDSSTSDTAVATDGGQEDE